MNTLPRRYQSVRRLTARLAFLPFLLCLIGCASERPGAAALANRGGEAVRGVQSAMLENRAGLDRLIEQRAALEALTGRNPLSDQAKASIARIQQSLDLRVRMLGDLADVYQAWLDLAQYDAAGEFSTGMTTLAGSVNAFATTVGNDTQPITDAMTTLIGQTAAMVAIGDQNAKLKEASEISRKSLEQVIELLNAEENIHVSVREELVRKSEQTSNALVETGIGSPLPILEQLLGEQGYAFDQAAAKRALADATQGPKLMQAADAVAKTRTQRRVSQQRVVYKQSVAVLESLRDEQNSFEQGQAPSIDSITTELKMLQVLIETITEVAREHR